MFVDQRLHIDVREDVAAVCDKRLGAEMLFRILDAAASLKQIPLVDERNRMADITIGSKKVLK